MIGTLLKLGVPGAVGLLLGLAMVWWVEPTTDGGTALLLVIAIAVCIVVGQIVLSLRKLVS